MEQNPQNALWYVNKKTTSIRQEVINLRLGMILAAQLPHDTLTSFMTSNTRGSSSVIYANFPIMCGTTRFPNLQHGEHSIIPLFLLL